MFGLREHDIDEIIHHLNNVDMKGTGLNFGIISKISCILNEETIMPYHFDVLNYHDIGNEDLIAHIDRVGITIYHTEITTFVKEPKIIYKMQSKEKRED